MKNKENCQQTRLIKGIYSCDNYADVYIGNCKELTNKIADSSTLDAVQFEAKASCDQFIYFVCWSDNGGLNGLLAELHGANTVFSGTHAKWEVFPTGINFSTPQTRPSAQLVNTELKKAHCKKWKAVTKGVSNGNRPFRAYPKIDKSAHFIWYDSGKDSSAGAPFQGFNHDEFLIFRFPISELFAKECHDCTHDCECVDDCHCSVCAAAIGEEQKVLKEQALGKSFLIKGKENNSRRCKTPYSEETCSMLDLPTLEPCFYLHWGDGKRDQLESRDQEVVYITACNPYGNLRFRGLTITNISIVPKGQSGTVVGNGNAVVSQSTNVHTPIRTLGKENATIVSQVNNTIQLIPSRLIHFGDLCGCTCASQELHLLTENATPQDYEILVDYCIDQIEINQDNTGKTRFPITVIKS
ncbi:hypothetical protein KORDIASMS9_01148 [Kordia sp. SMS9]|uniref:hypothetical protein n=1 Tax=Kordia sp. SMS9 TaxID=2282170 RepID=UPI000E0D9226|nr:hypothetical protein [Kordia sp. SMS9]AXG68929.1 hypothetical protein KORDIASMS9_01148 [Kordia sp. SMS9]